MSSNTITITGATPSAGTASLATPSLKRTATEAGVTLADAAGVPLEQQPGATVSGADAAVAPPRSKSPKLAPQSSPQGSSSAADASPESQGEAKQQEPDYAPLAGTLGMAEYGLIPATPEMLGTSTRGICFIVFKVMPDGTKKLLLVREDRTPIHEGPLVNPGEALLLDGKDVRAAMSESAVARAENLQRKLHPYHYMMVALREACVDPLKRMGNRKWDELSDEERVQIYTDRLDKGLREEIHSFMVNPAPRAPDAYSHWKYKGRDCYQPVYFVNANDLRHAVNPSPLRGFRSAKAIKLTNAAAVAAGFVSHTHVSLYPSVLKKDLGREKNWTGKWKLKCDHSETRPYHCGSHFLDDCNFLPANKAIQMLRDYAERVSDAKKEAIALVDGKTSSNFELSRWGQQLLTDNEHMLHSMLAAILLDFDLTAFLLSWPAEEDLQTLAQKSDKSGQWILYETMVEMGLAQGKERVDKLSFAKTTIDAYMAKLRAFMERHAQYTEIITANSQRNVAFILRLFDIPQPRLIFSTHDTGKSKVGYIEAYHSHHSFVFLDDSKKEQQQVQNLIDTRGLSGRVICISRPKRGETDVQKYGMFHNTVLARNPQAHPFFG